MLTEIIRDAIEKQADMEILTYEDCSADAALMGDVDVIVTGNTDPQAVADLLGRDEERAVFALACDGKDASVYQLQPQHDALGELSPRQLIEEIRGRRAGVPRRRQSRESR